MKILNYKVEVGQWYLATFDVYLEKAGLTFRKLKLCKSKKGHNYIKPPEFKGEDGKYIPYFQFEPDRMREFLIEVGEQLIKEASEFSNAPTIRDEPIPF